MKNNKKNTALKFNKKSISVLKDKEIQGGIKASGLTAPPAACSIPNCRVSQTFYKGFLEDPLLRKPTILLQQHNTHNIKTRKS